MGPCASADDCNSLDGACVDGICINGVCQTTPTAEGGPCDDGKTCTTNDHCEMGLCTGTLKSCPSSNSCQVGFCDTTTDQCTEIPGNDGAGCIDDDPCTLTATCSNGSCVPGQLVDCSFLDSVCGQGTCDPQIGCVAMPLNDGTSCDDGLYCTVSDTCTAGSCKGAPNTCAAPGDVCKVGSCNEANDTCVAVPGNDGGACDDLNTCTSGEKCAAGLCVGGVPANNGVMCDDGNACTVNGVCNAAGGCIGAQVVACTSGDGCCPAGCAFPADDDCCGNDCWGVDGCTTATGRCIRFSCRPGDASPTFCSECMGAGWGEITYNEWLNGGLCSEIITKYRAVEGYNTKCGGGAQQTCCADSALCGGGDNAWHFSNGVSTYYVGPVLGDSGAGGMQCDYWNNIEGGSYPRITACQRN
jgi:hypothetical protein